MKARDKRKLKGKLLKKHRGKCFYCGSPATTIDHRVPKCRGGKNVAGNLVLCCDGCNQEKADMTWIEYVRFRERRKPSEFTPDHPDYPKARTFLKEITRP